ncbi:helix-turn-helix transcriptional regulator [Streptomyces sp. NBC_01481]|uniref:helix-turn-helix domain-containing protein n=1 Tax=Streptomyces sp. NBC_01481 TaxID=2975869 RepID=UPI0022517128|nr:helix-turn-helix transcriptional regulator [Streptomyces sp. NBC_01481]MCX4586785.1 helix-turn-helix transcriptional regulator [Streptomyces sp. NBC_01481]
MAIEDNPQSRERYGEELRSRREAAGLTQEELSQRAIMSRTHIAHIEAGRRRPSTDDARRLDQVLGTGGIFERFLPTLDGRKVAEHFEAAKEMEQQASLIREYATALVPGILQTEGYARAVFQSGFPLKTDEECDKALVTRLGRAHILENPRSPVVWALLDEAVFRRPVGGPGTMAEQLWHIVKLGERRRVRVHVLPFGAGAHALMESMVSLMWFEDLPPIVYVEGWNTGKVWDLPSVVQQGMAAYDLALGDALSHHESLALIRSVAEEYERESQ